MVTHSTVLGSRVNDALMEDPRTRGSVIDVSHQQGVVTLTGTVNSWAIRQAAEEIARKTPGVVTVINDLKVK